MTTQQKIITDRLRANLEAAKYANMRAFCREQLAAWMRHVEPKPVKRQPNWDRICEV
jgi:hypothetical protein